MNFYTGLGWGALVTIILFPTYPQTYAIVIIGTALIGGALKWV